MSGIHFIGFSLSIATLIITLSYLGPTFEEPSKIDPNDWKRKWIIFFAWFNLVTTGVLFLIASGIITGFVLGKRARR